MQAAIAPCGDARTYLIHFVSGGLDDERYIVERFRSLANGKIVPAQSSGAARKGQRKARGTIVTAKALEEMRPARDEIIIATGIKLRHCGCSCEASAASVSSPTAASAVDRPARPAGPMRSAARAFAFEFFCFPISAFCSINALTMQKQANSWRIYPIFSMASTIPAAATLHGTTFIKYS